MCQHKFKKRRSRGRDSSGPNVTLDSSGAGGQGIRSQVGGGGVEEGGGGNFAARAALVRVGIKVVVFFHKQAGVSWLV